MSLFDEMDRVVDDGADAGEGSFQYLNRSGREPFAKVRLKFDEYFEEYPDPHKAQLRSRFRTDDGVSHESAAFELLLHASFVRQGCVIEAVEPPLAHTPRSPDFLIRTGQGERFYLEATLATGATDAERRAQRRVDAAIEAVSRVRSDDFLLDANFVGIPREPVRLSRLRAEIEQWLAGLHYEDVQQTWQAAVNQPAQFVREVHGLTVELRPIPKPRRDEAYRTAIAIQSGGVWARTVGGALRAALQGKASRYGDLDLPYVIAVNGLNRHADRHDLLAALLGNEVVRIPLMPDGQGEGRWDRSWDGLWIAPNRQRRATGVSGVLVADDLRLWSASSRAITYVGHIAPRRPLQTFPLPVTTLLPVGDELMETPGEPLGAILGLDPEWPGDD